MELILIIVATGIISYKGFNDYYFLRRYEFHIESIKRGDHLRMFASGFLHADFLHLFFNLFALFMFAPKLIETTGGIVFLIIYLGSLLAGNLLTLYLHKNDLQYRAVGASGAVTGIVYASILLNPYGQMGLLFIPFISFDAYIFGIVYLLYSIYGIKSNSDNIGHSAHFGGAIGGFVFILIKYPAIISNNLFVVIAMALPIVILFVMSKNGKLK